MFVIPLNYGGGYWVVAIGGFVVLLLLNFNINTRGLNLFLLFLFTFVEGLALAPLLNLYLETANGGLILAEAFLLTAITSLSLSVYAWVTKRNFNRLGGILFMGVILLIVAMVIGIFFQSTIFALVISVLGVGIFSAYVLYYVQQSQISGRHDAQRYWSNCLAVYYPAEPVPVYSSESCLSFKVVAVAVETSPLNSLQEYGLCP